MERIGHTYNFDVDVESAMKILTYLNSSDVEMINLGVILFFEAPVSLKYDFFFFDKKEYMRFGTAPENWEHLKLKNTTGYNLYFRKGDYCLYKGWGFWIHEKIDAT